MAPLPNTAWREGCVKMDYFLGFPLEDGTEAIAFALCDFGSGDGGGRPEVLVLALAPPGLQGSRRPRLNDLRKSGNPPE